MTNVMKPTNTAPTTSPRPAPRPPLSAADFLPPPPAVNTARFKSRSTTRGITVHCTATRPSQDWGGTEIDRMHRNRGFFAIGYHFLILRDGRIQLGRPIDRVGAHAREGGRNSTHVSAALVGGISEKPQQHVPGNPWNGSDAEMNFTPMQFESLTRLIEYIRTYYRDPGLPVEGHRDVPGVSKACPSFQVGRWMQTGEAVL